MTTDHDLPLKKILPISSSTSNEGALTIGDCSTRDLANEFGTPLYIYDAKTLRNQASEYIKAFNAKWPYGVEVHYASKAWINVPMAQFLAGEGLSFDVVSGGEMAVLQKAGVDVSQSAFHGNNKTANELREALKHKLGQIVINSVDEIDLLESISEEMGIIPKVMLRISPSVDAHTHAATTTGLVDSKFGVAIENNEAYEACIQISEAKHLDFRGIHMHLGSPIFGMEPYIAGVKVGAQLVRQLLDIGILISDFSPGGGFAVAYTNSDDPPEPSAYADAICDTLAEQADQLSFPPPRLIIEPGRSLVARAGVALYSIGSRKEIPGVRTYVAVDGGMSDNIRPAIYGSKYEVMAAERPFDPAEETVTIAGKFCESGDVLARDVKLPVLKRDELIAIPTAGAYQLAMESNYNLSLKPAVIMVEDGKAYVIRRRETYDDLTNLDVTNQLGPLISPIDNR